MLQTLLPVASSALSLPAEPTSSTIHPSQTRVVISRGLLESHALAASAETMTPSVPALPQQALRVVEEETSRLGLRI